jgi:molecular chaperone HtpG
MPKKTSEKLNSEKINREGNISIHTENIFPIIKKWLYSDHEIFLRELVSNAFDAITKLQKIAITEAVDVRTPKINISIDKDNKTLTFSDTGLGLDAEEVEKYIAQIAFSGAEEFVQKFKDKNEDKENTDIIGHFGLGFYSAFMVADLVEIRSKSYRKEAQSILWTCDGSTKYTITQSDRTEVGTDIILHINEESKEYLEELRIKHLVEKYTNFLPVDIQVNGEKVNDNNPLWIKTPNECSEDEYKEFYKKLFPFNQEPLFWIHLNVDYPFNLKGILYFPKVMHELDANKGQIKLFCKQVFVSDNSKDVVPEFLTLLQGAIDCPEIPLNVSRSYLQNDPYVQKISKHIVKKVADKLNDLVKNDSENFENYWNDISPFIKYGMMQNDDFYSKVKDIILFDSSTDKKTSIPAYLERNKEKTANKVLYCSDKEAQVSYVELCKEQGLEVLFLHAMIDSHFIQFLESKESSINYVSIDSELSDSLVQGSDQASDNQAALTTLFKDALNNDKLKIEVKSLKSSTVSAMLLESEMIKRMKNMSHFSKGFNMPLFDDFTLVLNENNKLISDIITINNEGKQELAKKLCQHIFDLARLSKQPLTGEQMQAFILRSNELMSELSTK